MAIKRKPIYKCVLFAFSGLYQAHAGHFVNRKLIISGSHVTVNAPRECGMFGGIQ